MRDLLNSAIVDQKKYTAVVEIEGYLIDEIAGKMIITRLEFGLSFFFQEGRSASGSCLRYKAIAEGLISLS